MTQLSLSNGTLLAFGNLLIYRFLANYEWVCVVSGPLPQGKDQKMNRIATNAFVLISALGLASCTGFMEIFREKETIQISPEFSDVISIGDSDYQKMFAKTADLTGFCNDSFAKAISRKIFDYGNEAMLTITVDSIPLASYKYNNEEKKCEKAYDLQKEISRYALSRSVNNGHTFNLIYTDQSNINTVRVLLDAAAKLASANTLTLLEPATQELAKNVSTYFNEALEKAFSSSDSHKVGFSLPDNDGHSKLSVKAVIDGKAFTLAEVSAVVDNSLLSGKTAQSVMATSLLESRSVKDELSALRRLNNTVNPGGKLKVTALECNYLKDKYVGVLNDVDMEKLLESYLYTEHRLYVQRAHLVKCMQTSDEETLSDIDLKKTVKINSLPDSLGRDPNFLGYLDGGRYREIVKETTILNDPRKLINANSIEALVSYPNSSRAFCFQYLGKREVNFLKVINDKMYFFEAFVDMEYSTEQYEAGSISKLESISVFNEPADNYLEKRRSCISAKAQDYNIELPEI